MIFTELYLENFGPYAGKHTINLRPDIDGKNRPIILFGGMNGGGKTTLIDAIRLALYGSRAQCSTRGNLSYSEFLTQAVNNQSSPGDKTRIELAFEHLYNDQWIELRIVRTWTKNPKDGKDNLGVLDGEWPDSALASTWDEYIETLLPLGISNLFLFDGEQVKELAEQDIPPQPVIDAIQSLLGLELAERLAVDLDVLVGRKRRELATSVQLSDLEEIEVRLKKYQQDRLTAKEALSNWQKKLEEAQSKYEESYDKFRTEGGKIAAQRSRIENQKDELEKSLENQRTELVHLASGYLPLALIMPLLQQAKQQAETELKVRQAKIAQKVLQQRDQRLLSFLNDLSLTQKQLEKIEKFLHKENQLLNQQSEADIEYWLGANEEDLKQILAILEHQIPLQMNLGKKQLERLIQMETELETMERQLAVAASPEDYDKLDQELQEAQKQLVKIKSAYETGKRQCEEIEKAIEKTKKELARYGEDTIDRQNKEHLITVVKRVQQTLQVFREKLTQRKLNKLEGEVTQCFRYLLHKSDLVHRVAIDKHNFALSLYDSDGQTVAKHRLSAGEKQLLAIAFLWGLARVSGRNLPVAIDTPLGRLDSSHRNNLVERYFPTASHQVILLSTDTEIGSNEVAKLRDLDAIAREYLLRYDGKKRQTMVESDRYFC